MAHCYSPGPATGGLVGSGASRGERVWAPPKQRFVHLAKQLELAKQGSAPALPGRWRSPPVPVVMPRAAAQQFLPSPGRSSCPGPCAGRGTHSSPAPPFVYAHQHSSGTALSRVRPTPATTHRAGGSHSTPVPPVHPPPPRRSRAACTRQPHQPPTYRGGGQKTLLAPARAGTGDPLWATCTAWLPMPAPSRLWAFRIASPTREKPTLPRVSWGWRDPGLRADLSTRSKSLFLLSPAVLS